MYTPTIALGLNDERMDMATLHHIMFSRALGVVVFCAFLILTPRAWVEPENRGATEEVPVDVLEAPSECLWCDPVPSSECDDSNKAKPTSVRPWLNPDESAMPLDKPCSDDESKTPHI